ncbi:hypothetical protein XA68_13617 [Ophiocordyceps unilateralis]|uniref:Peptidase A1 domain-containing protein n=1 Tax=Ophiocordyceps unilateralis TaxID=268505 RepID=A0A2A9PAD4_OPHUN|nr:hypothetical protein XA68_13617 [Ophiocordyceps unilateralis]
MREVFLASMLSCPRHVGDSAMKTTYSLRLAGIALPLAAAIALGDKDQKDGVLSLPVRATALPARAKLFKREDATGLSEVNAFEIPFIMQPDYVQTIDINIGTPGQRVTVMLDTGSNFLWVNPSCSRSAFPKACSAKPRFHESESSTYVDMGSQHRFTYLTAKAMVKAGQDTVSLGSASIVNQTFGVAKSSRRIGYGVMGLGSDDSPSIRKWSVVDGLFQQGIIKTKTISLAMRGPEAEGSVVFGGIDVRKFQGRLEKRPIIPAIMTPDGKSRYWVYLDGMSVQDEDGNKTDIFSRVDGVPVLLDSGSNFSILPTNWFPELVKVIPSTKVIRIGPVTLHVVDCSNRERRGHVSFTFGSTTIDVPFRRFIIVRPSNFCVLGALPNEKNFYILASNILMSAYTVFDPDNRAVYLARTSDCGSRIVALGNDSDPMGSSVGECRSVISPSTPYTEF